MSSFFRTLSTFSSVLLACSVSLCPLTLAQSVSPGSTWVQQSPATVPPARLGEMLAYDATHKQVVLFGGYSLSAGSALSDTWTYDGTTWTQHNVTGPSARYTAAMAYDPSAGQVLLGAGVVFLLQNNFERPIPVIARPPRYR